MVHYKFIEDERGACHEAGHSLINLLMVGGTGRIDLSKSGTGVCQVAWDNDPDLRMSDDDRAFVLFELTASLAGLACERYFYGNFSDPCGTADQHDFTRALMLRVHYPELQHLTRKAMGDVLDGVMERFEGPLRNAISVILPGRTESQRLWKAMHQADTTGELAAFKASPILQQGGWRRNWNRLVALAGASTAQIVSPAPVATEQPPTEPQWDARHAHWAEAVRRHQRHRRELNLRI